MSCILPTIVGEIRKKTVVKMRRLLPKFANLWVVEGFSSYNMGPCVIIGSQKEMEIGLKQKNQFNVTYLD